MARKKKDIIRTPKNMDEKYLGTEPVLTGTIERIDIQLAWNWYNYFCDVDKAKKYILDWMRSMKYKKETIEMVRSADKNSIYSIGLATGWTARLLSRGSTLPEKYETLVKDRVDRLIKENKPETISIQPSANTNRVSVQTYMFRQAHHLIAELEDALEVTLVTKGKFEPYVMFQSGGYSSITVNKMGDRWTNELDELRGAYDRSDKQCVEAYSSMDRKELKLRIGLVQTIIDDMERYSMNNKKVRKPRKSKPTPATKQVAKVNYQKEDKELKLVSVDPLHLVGSQQAWLFNTKYRQLVFYEADGPSGLQIKGTTLRGWNTQTAELRKIRKPEETLDSILKASKTKALKVFKELTTRPTMPRGRINSDTIILKVIK